MKQSHQQSEHLTFEKVWMTIQENNKILTEKFQETDKILTEKFQETDKMLTEMSKETDKKIQETDKILTEMSRKTDKKINKLERLFTGQWGKLVESLVEGDLVNLLRKRGILIQRTSQREKSFYQGREIEIDVIARNGDEVVVVEVKTTLYVEDVKYFIEKKLEVFRKVFPEFNKKKNFGAVAYLRTEEEADKYAYRQGLFVIKATGNSATIINDAKFKPKVF